MQNTLKQNLPEWVHTKQDRSLTLSNDMDSLLSCALLKKVFDYDINHFYAFIGFATKDQTDKRKSIGVDIALNNGYCYDNHLTMMHRHSNFNPDSANPNVALKISNDNYNQKYSMSTFIFLWGLYDLPLPESDFGKKILLTIDSGHKGYRKPQYRHILTGWLQRLGLEDLIQTLQDNTYNDLSNFAHEKGLGSSIILNTSNQLEIVPKGELDLCWIGEQLGFNVELPSGIFTPVAKLDMKDYTKNRVGNELDTAFSHAFTFKDKIRLSAIDNKRGA